MYFCLAHHTGGPDGVADELASLAAHPTVRRATEILRDKFATIDSIGPVWAARVSAETGADLELTQRDAFERAQALIRSLERHSIDE